MTSETTTDAPPLTPYEQAVLHLAHFDLNRHSLLSKVDNVLKSRRPIGTSQTQEAVLSSELNALFDEAGRPKPEWGQIEKSQTIAVLTPEMRAVVAREVKCLRRYAVECFPEVTNGQVHFARAIMEGVAAELEETFGPFVS